MQIEQIRKGANLTQEQFAREIGVSVRTVSFWETQGHTTENLRGLSKQSVLKFAKRRKLEG